MDAVFAIAITLPIVELTPPTVTPQRDLATGYRDMGPGFAAYFLGFVAIGVFWNYSHFGSKLLKRTDHGFNLLTLLFLACVSLTPFPAKPFIEHYADPANADAAALIYGCALSAPTLAWFARWCWGYPRGLYDDRLSRRYVRTMTARWAAAAAVALGGIAQLAFGLSESGLATVVLALTSFLLPPVEPFDKEA